MKPTLELQVARGMLAAPTIEIDMIQLDHHHDGAAARQRARPCT
ncbi:MAG: hypothetical protein NTY08_17015 [Proteobacteria bacterium]|nr:hypothetical protein [Pseudomonadota bacterium]